MIPSFIFVYQIMLAQPRIMLKNITLMEETFTVSRLFAKIAKVYSAKFFKIRHPRKFIPVKTHQDFSILKRFSFLFFFDLSKNIRRFLPQLIAISPRIFGY